MATTTAKAKATIRYLVTMIFVDAVGRPLRDAKRPLTRHELAVPL
jgi:hypothetical protein